MKNLTILIFAFFLITPFGRAHISSGNSQVIVSDPNMPEYKQGEILVMYKDDVIVEVKTSKGIVQTGVKALDQLNEKWQVSEMEKVFRNAKVVSETLKITMPSGEQRQLKQLFNVYKLKFPETTDVDQVLENFRSLSEVEYAEYNGSAGIVGGIPTSEPFSGSPSVSGPSAPSTLIVTPNDPLYSQQWYIPHVNADSLWDFTTGDTTQVIGILDTGVDWLHPDLVNKIWSNANEIPANGIDDDNNGFIDDVRGWDFVNDDNNPHDDNSHGTHCAGIAAAETNNGTGIAGVSWGAKIMPLKCFQSNGIGYFSDIAESFWYAAQNGCTVFSNSWLSSGESITIRLAMEYAYSQGLIVAAAGNMWYKTDLPFPPWPPYQPNYPACYNWVLGVEATDQNGNNTWFSNFDPTGPIISDGRPYGSMYWNDYDYNYEMRAPGVSFISTVPNGQYRSYSGTSMACPLVAGCVALMKSYDTLLSNEQVFAKLIQPIKISLMQAGVLDILTCTMTDPPPDLYYVSHSISDSLYGGDDDGRPDAGETIDMYVNVKNAGGYGDSVYAKLRFTEFEDTTTAQILDSTCFLGNISAYGTQTSFDPIKIKIDSNVVHFRIISFQLLIWQLGSTDTIYQGITLTIEHGIEIKGNYSMLHLTGDAYYIVSDVAVIDSLIIDPGVTLTFNPSMFVAVTSYLFAVGTPDSLITFTGVTEGYYWNGIVMSESTNSLFEFCKFEYGKGNNKLISNPGVIKNCIFQYCKQGITNIDQAGDVFNNNVITNHNGYPIDGAVFVGGDILSEVSFNIIAENICDANHTSCMVGSYMRCPSDTLEAVRDNVFINNSPYNLWLGTDALDFKYLPANYFGDTDTNYIHTTILDFYELGGWPGLHIVELNGILTFPPPECHGVVWKVELNGQNPQVVQLDPIGAGPLKFDVYFNRAMDISYTPFATFGVRFPYTQNIVMDSASWSADSTIWTAYHTINIASGDGENTIRVAHARDTDHFEIPIERSRFKFVIQAASSQSVAFMATPGIGKVNLEWPFSDSLNVLGYNLYRYKMYNDTTYTDTTMLNSELIFDSTYTDFNILPDSTYYYMFSIVRTDFSESDYSKVVAATPFDAANGDANGDLAVNVLDITAVVAYMLDQNPQPFLFDAADVNGDDVINVLDIIGIVDIILGKKKLVSQVIGTNTNLAYIYLDPDGIRFKSEGQVAAMQFELAGQNLEQIKLLMKQQGFEFASGVVNGKLMGILYNFQNRTIPEGMMNLISIEERASTLSWGDVVAGDPEGNYVLVLKDEPKPLPVEDYELKAFPNPFKESVTITYRLPEPATVTLQFYNSHGQLIQSIENREKPAGSHQLEWNGKGAPAGIYYCRLQGITKQGKEIKSEIKMVLIK